MSESRIQKDKSRRQYSASFALSAMETPFGGKQETGVGSQELEGINASVFGIARAVEAELYADWAVQSRECTEFPKPSPYFPIPISLPAACSPHTAFEVSGHY